MPTLHRRLLLSAVAALGLVVGSAAHADVTLLNVSYDPTRELYQDLNAAFAKKYRADTGEAVSIQMSHGGSGKQARAVIDGLDADIVTLALAADIDAIASKTDKLPEDWQSRLPNASSPYTSTIVFIVRKGNPQGIKDWSDLAKPGVAVITPNPKTSGGARWNYLAAYGWALDQFGGDETKAKQYLADVFKNVPVLDTGARASTTTFAQREIGDVLISWENEAFLVLNEFGADKFEVVVPSESIKAEPPVALIDGNVDAKGTRKAAEAYLQYLYTPEAQASIAKHYYRPYEPQYAAKEDLARFPDIKLFDISRFGGWKTAQATHFADGGVFDQIYKPGN
ncbi:MAG: sulfate ABC transporter substrate-binding protein [Geminicoccaceae bacterium]